MLLYDFDGVLIDSAREASLSAYNTVFKKQYTALEQLPEGCIDLFFKNIFHFHNPYTLCNLIKWCGENCKLGETRILTRSEFKDYCALQADIKKEEITPYFYSVRVNFMEANPKEWLELNRPFFGLWNALKERGAEDVVILTAKNKQAVIRLCHHYGLMVLEENVYAGDGNVTKMDNFRSIHNRFNLPSYNFIDDHLSNLVDLNNAFKDDERFSLNLYLCDWGYGHEEDKELAKKLGFRVVGMDEVSNFFPS